MFAGAVVISLPATAKAAGQGVLTQMMQAINSTQGQAQIDLSGSDNAFTAHNKEVDGVLDRMKAEDPRAVVVPDPAPATGQSPTDSKFLELVSNINQVRGVSGNAAQKALDAAITLDSVRSDLNSNVHDRLPSDAKSIGLVAQVNQAYAALQKSASNCPTVADTFKPADDQKMSGQGVKQDMGAMDKPTQDAQSAVSDANNAIVTCEGDAADADKQKTDEQTAQQKLATALQKVNAMRTTAANEVNFLNYTVGTLDRAKIKSASATATQAITDANSASSQITGLGVNVGSQAVIMLRLQNAKTLNLARAVVAAANHQLK
jgi:hypothetical protein